MKNWNTLSLRFLFVSISEFLRKGWSPYYVENVNRKGKLIGHRRASLNFAHYIKNQKYFDRDDLIHEFFNFYCNNWENSRSSWAQDIFVFFFYQQIKPKSVASNDRKKFKYLDIGAWDGVTSSNTYSLSKLKEWSGCLVEPNKNAFRKLSILRKNDQLINKAVVKSNFEKKIVNFWDDDMFSCIEGQSGNDKHHSRRLKFRKAYPVQTIKIQKLLQTRYDYLSLDIEGLEVELIESIDFNKTQKPALITIEHNYKTESKVRISELLYSQGYESFLSEHDWLLRGDSWFYLKGFFNSI